MQDLAIQFLKDINIAQLLAIGIMFWFFYSRLDKKIEKLENRMDKLENKISSLEMRVGNIETRVAVMESQLRTINENVSHLMWHHQFIRDKDADEQWCNPTEVTLEDIDKALEYLINYEI